MKKTVLGIMLLSLFAQGVQGRTLSPAEALSRAAAQKPEAVRGVSRGTDVSSPVLTVGNPSSPSLYVFGAPEAGYLIVSADDVAAPVLGYSDSGTFDPTDIPDNMRWWLDCYRSEISHAAESGAASYEATLSAERKAIEPLVNARWDQGVPYNGMCPQLNGQTTVTGCVATAMAQVMKYHNWPEKLSDTAIFSYLWEAGEQSLSWNAAGLTLDWAAMLDEYRSGAYTQEQADAVATLMKACGYAVDMQYDLAVNGGSGAATLMVGKALLDYFDYDKATVVRDRNYYNNAIWEDMIYENLVNCGPVLYAGHNDNAGHAFVCDGYSSDSYFHFNWGWSGISDGYFRLSALSPSNQGIGGSTSGYNSGQCALLGARKPVADSRPAVNLLAIGDLTAIKSGNKVDFSLETLVNYSSVTLNGSVIALITHENGEIQKKYPAFGINDLKTGYQFTNAVNMSVPLTKSYFPEDGKYRVSLAFRENDGTITDIPLTADQPGYFIVTRNGLNNFTVTNPEPGEFSVTDLKMDSPLYQGSMFLASGNAVWTGETGVTKDVYGLLLNGNSVVAYGSTMTLAFEAGGVPVHFDYLSEWDPKSISELYNGKIPAGDYEFVMAVIEGNAFKPICEPIAVTMNEAADEARIEVVEWTVDNFTAVDPNDIVWRARVKCASGFYFGPILACVFTDEKEPQYINEFSSDVVVINAGETKEVVIKGALSGTTPGEQYLTALYDASGLQITNGGRFTIGDNSGILDVIADGSSLSVSPNPADSYTVITAPSAIERVELFSLSGMLASVSADIDGSVARLDVSPLASGLYVARVHTANGVTAVKIVKK